MRGKKILNGFLLVPFLILLFFFPIPGQDKLVCEFDDGDQIIIRQNYSRQLLGEFVAHVHNKIYRDSAKGFYKPKYGLEGWEKISGCSPRIGLMAERDRLDCCSESRKINGIISTLSKYKIKKEEFQNTPFVSGVFQENKLETRKKMEDNQLEDINGITIAQIEKKTLLMEAPLIKSPRETGCSPYEWFKGRPPCKVITVLQSYSTDNGQTWGKLELTTDAKLYELGIPIFEQKGVAKPVDWTGKPWFGKDE